jgi:hypothetical protein
MSNHVWYISFGPLHFAEIAVLYYMFGPDVSTKMYIMHHIAGTTISIG